MDDLLEEVNNIHLSSRRVDEFKAQVESVVLAYDLKIDENSIRFKHVIIGPDQVFSIKKTSIIDVELKKYFSELLEESLAETEAKVVELSKRSHKTVFRFAALDLFKKKSSNKKKSEPMMDEKSAEVLMHKSKELKAEYNKLLGLYNKMYLSHKEVYRLQLNDGSEYYLDLKVENQLLDFLHHNFNDEV